MRSKTIGNFRFAREKKHVALFWRHSNVDEWQYIQLIPAHEARIAGRGLSQMANDIDGKKKKKKKLICPTCRQKLNEMPYPGLNGKDCPQCGQGLSWRRVAAAKAGGA